MPYFNFLNICHIIFWTLIIALFCRDAGAIQVSSPALQGTKAETSIRSSMAWAWHIGPKILSSPKFYLILQSSNCSSKSCLFLHAFIFHVQSSSLTFKHLRLAAIRHFTTSVWQVLWSPICGRPCWPWAAIWPNWTRWELSKSWLDEKVPLVTAHVLFKHYDLMTSNDHFDWRRMHKINMTPWLNMIKLGGTLHSKNKIHRKMGRLHHGVAGCAQPCCLAGGLSTCTSW